MAHSHNTRKATHAGSWYSDSARDLNRQLDAWLSAVTAQHGPARAIIAPHAGYSYSGPTAAHAYKQVDPTGIERIFVLGPSHHVCLSGCALSQCSKYKTPLYDLHIDKQLNEELHATGAFEWMTHETDESEHSIEMHLPYIAKVMQTRSPRSFHIIPILVGSLNPSRQAHYGRIFARYLASPKNLFVVSSDFCHWGQRFHFKPYDSSVGEVYQSIEKMDREALRIIESQDPLAFNDYLKRTNNTICGRYPICIVLHAAEHFRQMNNHRGDFRFLHYTQSNRCRSQTDSSVSYAAGTLRIRHRDDGGESSQAMEVDR